MTQMDGSKYQCIVVARRGDVVTIQLNRPDRLNAISRAMADELIEALGHIAGARALHISGAGRAFCAGADLSDRQQRPGLPGQSSFETLSNHFNPLMLALANLELPIVAAVQGAAAGIGSALALAADFVVAGHSAYFLQPFASIGLVPDCGATLALPQRIGRARATELMMLGERLDARKAECWGLIYRSVDDTLVEREGLHLADRLASGPTVAFREMRHLIGHGSANLPDALRREAEAQRTAAQTYDAREGSIAFLEKRTPSFAGR